MTLSTKDPHPHVITAECPLPCLRGIVAQAALTALGRAMRDDAHPHGSLATLARWHQAGLLGEVRNIGPNSVTEISAALREAGIIPVQPPLLMTIDYG